MFEMFKDMEQKQQELREKLAGIVIEHASEDGSVVIRINGNKEIKDVRIAETLLGAENAEQMQDMLVVTLNEAIDAAETKAMEELQKQFGDLLPDIGNFGSPFTA